MPTGLLGYYGSEQAGQAALQPDFDSLSYADQLRYIEDRFGSVRGRAEQQGPGTVLRGGINSNNFASPEEQALLARMKEAPGTWAGQALREAAPWALTAGMMAAGYYAAPGAAAAGTGAGAGAVPAAVPAVVPAAAGTSAAAAAGAALPEIIVTGTLGAGLGAQAAGAALGAGTGLLASNAGAASPGASGSSAGTESGMLNADPFTTGPFANGGQNGLVGVGGGNAGTAASNGVIPGGAGMGSATGGGLSSLGWRDYADAAQGLLGNFAEPQQAPMGGNTVIMNGGQQGGNPIMLAMMAKNKRAQELRQKRNRTPEEEAELRELTNSSGILG